MADSTLLAVVSGLVVGVAFIIVIGLIYFKAPLIDMITEPLDRGRNQQIIDIILRDSQVTDLLRDHRVTLFSIFENPRYDQCAFAPPARVIMQVDRGYLFLSVDYINGKVVSGMMQVKGESTPIFSRPFDIANNTREYEEQIISGTVTVKPYDAIYIPFNVPECVLDAKVTGTFRVHGGTDNEIAVLFMPKDAYDDWRSGGNLRVYAGTGKLASADIDFGLPHGNNAYLVFDNTFSNNTKTVVAEMKVSYMQ